MAVDALQTAISFYYPSGKVVPTPTVDLKSTPGYFIVLDICFWAHVLFLNELIISNITEEEFLSKIDTVNEIDISSLKNLFDLESSPDIQTVHWMFSKIGKTLNLVVC